MKKWSLSLVLLVGVVGFSYAGQPKDQNPNSWSNFMHGNPVVASSFTTAGINNFALPAPGTSQGQNCQTCLTRLILQMTPGATAYLLESGTTDFTLLGQGIGGTTAYMNVPNTISLPEDHLGPLCAQNGNTFSINVLPTSGVNPASVNAEGYVDCGGSRN